MENIDIKFSPFSSFNAKVDPSEQDDEPYDDVEDCYYGPWKGGEAVVVCTKLVRHHSNWVNDVNYGG